MDDSTRADYFRLLSLVGSRTRGLGDLLRDCGSPQQVLAVDDDYLASFPQETQKMVHRARRGWAKAGTDAEAPFLFSSASSTSASSASLSASASAPPPCSPDKSARGDSTFIPIGDPRYPPALRSIPDPPPWLFCQGDPAVLSRPAIAMVGSRRASHAGLSAAEQIARRLAAAGYTVCSGLALGIDGAAHRGALQSGYTVAVLASGLDLASPYRHRKLAEDIRAAGCLVTELPFGTAPSKHQFPRRNRIISGLARATIIVEAALPSGSLHTAAAALEQGREVLTLPWSLFHSQGAGCRQLLRDGATLISSLDDLPELFPGVEGAASTQAAALPRGAAGELLRLLGDGALSAEDLARASGLGIGPLLVLLGELEVAGWLSRADGLYSRGGCKPCESPASC